MERIFERFSCNNWMLVHNSNKVCSFINDFELEPVIKNITWYKSIFVSIEKEKIPLYKLEVPNADKLVVVPEIKEYAIIEGEAIDYLGKEFCEYFSNSSDVYRFNIDIWIPTMYFEYYKNRKLIRRVEYECDSDTLSIDPIEIGKKLIFEDKIAEIPIPDIGYGYGPFFYPLAIMNYLGISLNDLQSFLDTDCTIYRLPEKYKKQIIAVRNAIITTNNT